MAAWKRSIQSKISIEVSTACENLKTCTMRVVYQWYVSENNELFIMSEQTNYISKTQSKIQVFICQLLKMKFVATKNDENLI